MARVTVEVIIPPTPEQIRDLLLSLPENERIFIISDPEPGQYRILAIRKIASDVFEYDWWQ